jgi:hypothetical protein
MSRPNFWKSLFLNQDLWSIVFLFIFAFSLFNYTVNIRRPWFGELSYEWHQFVTAATVKYARGWYRDGLVNSKFAMANNPISIENPVLVTNDVYLSYPPGSVLPIYLIGKLTGREPTVAMVMGYNLLNHFAVALSMGLLIYVFLRSLRFNRINSSLLSIIPISLTLLLPGPLYWFQNVYYADQAAILPLVLYILLETLRSHSIHRRKWLVYLEIAQALLMLYGVLTDWTFIFLAITVFFKRFFNRELGKSVTEFFNAGVIFWFPVLLGMAFFVWQLITMGDLQMLIAKALERTGLSATGASSAQEFFKVFWGRSIWVGFGKAAAPLLWISLLGLIGGAFLYIRNKYRNGLVSLETRQILNLISLLIIPSFLYVFVFRNFSTIHDFTALKFIIPFATVPFVLLPLLISHLFFQGKPFQAFIEGIQLDLVHRIQNLQISTMAIGLILLTGIPLSEYGRIGYLFPKSDPNIARMGNFIGNNSTYQDVFFSPNFSIEANPPHLSSFTMKIVYPAYNVDEIYAIVKDVNGEYVINIFSKDKAGSEASPDPGLQELIQASDQEIKSENLFLYKINKAKFLEIYAKFKV